MTAGEPRSDDPSLPTGARAVCFDLDDTLYPYEEYARAGLSAAAERLREATGQDLRSELLELYFDEGVTEGTFDRVIERRGLDPDLVGDLVAAFHDSSGSLDPYDDAEAVLDRLGERHRLGVVTDGKNGREKLDRLGLADHFDAVVVTPDLEFTKRDRRAFETSVRQLGVDPERTVYVGDDPRVDFRGPNRMGMGTVRIRRGRYADLDAPDEESVPDHEIDRLDGLRDLLSDGPEERSAEDGRSGRSSG